jgi:arsenite methyltransferase
MKFDVKEKVKEKYGDIAKKVSTTSKSSCCGSKGCCSDISNTSVIYNGQNLADLPKEAINASLGCANPLLFAKLKEGETVLDLGSGGGIDVLMASKYVGETGKVYGLDMTDEMLELANKNKAKMGATNVEFLKGYIEEIPLENDTVDVIMSNCVINLSDDKEKALKEAYRVLKAGGRLAIADIVTLKDVPDEVRKMAELWVGCIAGTVKIGEYKLTLEKAGFKNIEIEPAHVYTKEVIQGLLQDKRDLFGNIDIDLNVLDGAFAGAFIKAVK